MEETEDNLEDSNIKLTANELLAFQRDLEKEKELLRNIISKIDDQVDRLKVEQLNLLGLINKSLKGTNDKSPPHESTNDNQQDYPTNKLLDLSVASALKYFEEEVEDENDCNE